MRGVCKYLFLQIHVSVHHSNRVVTIIQDIGALKEAVVKTSPSILFSCVRLGSKVWNKLRCCPKACSIPPVFELTRTPQFEQPRTASQISRAYVQLSCLRRYHLFGTLDATSCHPATHILKSLRDPPTPVGCKGI